MDETQRAAFLMAQAAAALIEAFGMVADNMERTANGHTIAYDGAAFQAVIDRCGIGHNAAVTWLTGQ